MPLPLQYGERIHCLDFKTGTRKNCSINFLVHSHNPIHLVLFSFGDGRGVLDFVVLNVLHQVLIMFLSSFRWILNMFLKFSMCYPTCSQYHLFLSHMVCLTLSSWNLCCNLYNLSFVMNNTTKWETSKFQSCFAMVTWIRPIAKKTSELERPTPN